MRTAATLTAICTLLLSLVAHAWDDKSAGADLPWLGGGGRAHLYHQRSSCFGCPTGYRDEQRWGRSAWSGEDPYVTVSRAMSFLARTDILAKAPRSRGAGDVGGAGGEGGIISPRALPYHFTVVMIEPTVVVMNFDLGALIHEGEPNEGQIVGSAYIDGNVSYGTRVPATGTLLWFSPDAKQAPAPVPKQSTGHGEIAIGKVLLGLDRAGDTWVVSRR
jgi:hypothetical protein